MGSGPLRSGIATENVLLSERRLREYNLFEPAAVARLVSKVRQGRDLGITDNMAFVGILSAQLVADQFIRSFPG